MYTFIPFFKLFIVVKTSKILKLTVTWTVQFCIRVIFDCAQIDYSEMSDNSCLKIIFRSSLFMVTFSRYPSTEAIDDVFLRKFK